MPDTQIRLTEPTQMRPGDKIIIDGKRFYDVTGPPRREGDEIHVPIQHYPDGGLDTRVFMDDVTFDGISLYAQRKGDG